MSTVPNTGMGTNSINKTKRVLLDDTHQHVHRNVQGARTFAAIAGIHAHRLNEWYTATLAQNDWIRLVKLNIFRLTKNELANER